MLEALNNPLYIGLALAFGIFVIVRVRLDAKARKAAELVEPLMARQSAILGELDKLTEMFDTEAEDIALLKVTRLSEEMRSISAQIAVIKAS